MFRFRLRHVIVMMTWSIVSGAILVAAFSSGFRRPWMRPTRSAGSAAVSSA